MTTAETLLAERLDDLGPEKPAGNVRTMVDHLLSMAWGALWHDDYEHPDMITAEANIRAAIGMLTVYLARLKQLDEIGEEEACLAAGWTKCEGGGWTIPESAATSQPARRVR